MVVFLIPSSIIIMLPTFYTQNITNILLRFVVLYATWMYIYYKLQKKLLYNW